jgi:hypothetical protein
MVKVKCRRVHLHQGQVHSSSIANSKANEPDCDWKPPLFYFIFFKALDFFYFFSCSLFFPFNTGD